MTNLVYQRYPLHMTHPGFRPATISDDSRADGRAMPGQATMFPPVIVNNEDQEEQYAAKGYRTPGEPNAQAYETNRAAPGLLDHQPQQWPQWKDGILQRDPQAVLDDKTWPMWVTPEGQPAKIVQGPEEYQQVMGKPYGAPVHEPEPAKIDDGEMAEFLAWKAARAKPPETAEMPAPDHGGDAPADLSEREQAIKLAEQRGVTFDKRWKTERIVEAIETAASAPTA